MCRRRLSTHALTPRRRAPPPHHPHEPGVTPDQYCQDKAAQSGSSFYYSFLFLPAERRRAITALYARAARGR